VKESYVRQKKPIDLMKWRYLLDDQYLNMLVTVASIITGFGIAMLFFRIQREIDMHSKGETIWIPSSDWLMIYAILISLLLVILPAILNYNSTGLFAKIPRASSIASIILVIGYIPGILAHYRLIFGMKRKGPRENPEPPERLIILATKFCSIVAFVFALFNKI
jgi:hypothetical protein